MTPPAAPSRGRPDEPPLLRVSTPSGVVAAVPHLLGFRPRCCVVLVLLGGERQRVRATLRVPLPTPEELGALLLQADRADCECGCDCDCGADCACGECDLDCACGAGPGGPVAWDILLAQQAPVHPGHARFAEALDLWAHDVAIRTVHAQADAVLLVAYPDGPAGTGADTRVDGWRDLPGRAETHALAEVLPDVGLRVRDALCVIAERWWSFLCSDPRCCPAPGRPVDDSEALRVSSSLVLSGRGFAPDRETLQRSLDPASPVVQARVQQVLAGEEVRLARLISGEDVRAGATAQDPLVVVRTDGRTRRFEPAQVDLPAYELWRDQCVARLGAWVAEIRDRGAGVAPSADPSSDATSAGELDVPVARPARDATPCDQTVAEVVLALHDVRVRDTWLWDLLHEDRPATWRAASELLGHCVRRAPRSWVGPAATCAAVSWWMLGDGAMANVALDVALAVDPDYSLARLVRTGIDRGLPPGSYRQALGGLSRDDCRFGPPRAPVDDAGSGLGARGPATSARPGRRSRRLARGVRPAAGSGWTSDAGDPASGDPAA